VTYAPAQLKATAAYWVAQGGTNLGIVGDPRHVGGGVSYHLGRDQLTAGAYSRQTTRDRAGLSDGASAIDLGRLHGSLEELRAFSSWLVSTARRNLPGTSDMREIIWTPDGLTVLRWDRQRGYRSAPRGGEADRTHLTHTHISWYRDAEQRDHSTAFRPYFAEDNMPGLTFRFVDRVPGIATVVGGGHSLIRTDTGTYAPVPAGQLREVAGAIVLVEPWGSWPIGTEGYLVGNVPGLLPDKSIAAMLLKKDCSFAPATDCAELEAQLAQGHTDAVALAAELAPR
jgi:hypothetical protein